MKSTQSSGAAALAASAFLLGGISSLEARTVTFAGVRHDQTNFSSSGLDLGHAGYWFPQFNAASPVTGQPTNDNDRNALPAWAPLNFTTNPSDPTRSFSLDNGGVKSEGGDLTWNNFVLPNGETGLSGSVVDPQTVANSNNTINKIVLTAGDAGHPLPQAFLLSIVIDNTNHEHDPVNRLRPRGQSADGTVDVGVQLGAADLSFNGVADAYTFRYDGWQVNDFIKLQINGTGAPKTGAGFAGLMFDVVPEPCAGSMLVTALVALCGASHCVGIRTLRVVG